eukprot:1161603-Pelagomonas_calceolata.AAC.22
MSHDNPPVSDSLTRPVLNEVCHNLGHSNLDAKYSLASKLSTSQSVTALNFGTYAKSAPA